MALGRALRLSVVAIVVVASLVCITWRVENVRQVRATKEAWEVFRATRVGQKVNASELQQPWECSSAAPVTKCSFEVRSWPATKGKWTASANSLIRKVGLLLWYVEVDFDIDENSIVTSRHFMLVTTDRSSQYGEPAISMWDGHHAPFSIAQYRHPEYEVRRLQKGPTLLITIGRAAGPTFIQHATDINFDCLSRIRGCESFSQLAPSAWADYMLDSRAE
jgi:hypothetical protein